MPYADGVYTPASGALTAAAGQIIASATWDNIHADFATALSQLGAAQIPVLQTSIAPARHTFLTLTCNLSTSTPGIVNYAASAGDVGVFNVELPSSTTSFAVNSIRAMLPGAGTAFGANPHVALYTGAGGTGTLVIGAFSLTLTSSAVNTSNNSLIVASSIATNTAITAAQLFVNISTSAATASTAFTALTYEPVA